MSNKPIVRRPITRRAETVHLMHYRGKRHAAICGADSGINHGKQLKLDWQINKITCGNCMRCIKANRTVKKSDRQKKP